MPGNETPAVADQKNVVQGPPIIDPELLDRWMNSTLPVCGTGKKGALTLNCANDTYLDSVDEHLPLYNPDTFTSNAWMWDETGRRLQYANRSLGLGLMLEYVDSEPDSIFQGGSKARMLYSPLDGEDIWHGPFAFFVQYGMAEQRFGAHESFGSPPIDAWPQMTFGIELRGLKRLFGGYWD